jgi:hypothetical protein
MSNECTSGIPGSAKIIIGVERSERTGWFLLHLHDCLNAVSIRPDEGVIVIAEGRGRGRLRNTRIPFKDIMRLDTYEIQVGHNCFSYPVNPEGLGSRETVNEERPFTPVGLRLLIGSLELDYLSIHDLGASPLPILVPMLKRLPAEAFGRWDMRRIESADDCYTFSKQIVQWARDADRCIEEANIAEAKQKGKAVSAAGRAAASIPSGTDSLRSSLADKCSKLDLSNPIDYQALLNAHQAVYVWRTFVVGSIATAARVRERLRRIRKINHIHTFPILAGVNETGELRIPITIENLHSELETFLSESDCSVENALELVSHYIRDPEEMNLSMPAVDALFEELKSKRINIIDPAKEISDKHSFFTEHRLWHAAQVEQVIEDEDIDVCNVQGLKFLSLLAEYETEHGERRYVIIIKDGLPQALNEFLLAHELGHWHLHAKIILAKEFRPVTSYLRSSGQPTTFLEDQADHFAMSLLFPAPYLADQEIFQEELSVEWLYEEFMKDLPNSEKERPKLKNAMLKYIRDHITRYQEFKDDGKPMFFLEVRYVEESNLGALIKILRSTGKDRWVRLDPNSTIVDASENCTKLFGRPLDSIIGAVPVELIAAEEQDLMVLRAEQRKNKKKPIYYFTKLTNGQQVIVYSFPILRDEEYMGAIAILIPVNEIEPSFSSLEDRVHPASPIS